MDTVAKTLRADLVLSDVGWPCLGRGRGRNGEEERCQDTGLPPPSVSLEERIKSVMAPRSLCLDAVFVMFVL